MSAAEPEYTPTSLQVLALEMRVGFAEARARDAELRHDLMTRLDTITGAIADLRQEYRGHVHPDSGA